MLDSTHEDVWLPLPGGPHSRAQWSEFEAPTRSPGRSCWTRTRKRSGGMPPCWWTTDHWSGTPGESERAAAPDAARRSGPRRPLPRRRPSWPSDWMERIMTALQEDLAKLVPNARTTPSLPRAGHNIHQDQAGAGHRGDPGGGRGGAQPKHLDPQHRNPGCRGTAGRQRIPLSRASRPFIKPPMP